MCSRYRCAVTSCCIVLLICIGPLSRNVRSSPVRPQKETAQQKPVPPIDVNWRLASTRRVNVGTTAVRTPRTNGYAGVGRIRVNIERRRISLFALDGNANVDLSVTSEGGVSIVQQPFVLRSSTVKAVAAVPRIDTVPFTIADGQRGVLVAEASALDADGKTEHVRRSYLYFLADRRKLFTSTHSFIDLDIQKLKSDRAAGLITQQQYQSKLQQLLRGGAMETN